MNYINKFEKEYNPTFRSNMVKMVMDKIYKKEKLDIDEYRFLLEEILNIDEYVVEKHQSAYFASKIMAITVIWKGFTDTIKHYDVGVPEDIGYKIRVIDINRFKDGCIDFIKRMFDLYSDMLSAEELTELSKNLERQAFEKT